MNIIAIRSGLSNNHGFPDEQFINIAANFDSDISKQIANRHEQLHRIRYTKEKQMLLKPFQPSVEIAVKLLADEFESDALDEHNKLRALHGCPPLKLNRNLCNFAKEWAKYLADRNTLEHRSNNKYGENLYTSHGEVNGRTAVRSWYDQIKYYRFEFGGFIFGTDDFTQVVWKGSKELGVAFVKSGNSTYVVANYSPPGNYARKFRENVPPPL